MEEQCSSPVYYIASDGTRCTSEDVRDRHEQELVQAKERAAKWNNDLEKLNATVVWLATHRVTAEYARKFYEAWSACAGWGNWMGMYRERFVGAKERIIAVMMRRARKSKWLVWRQGNVLYIESPFGQCSWHMSKYSRNLVEYPWFYKIPERTDLRWSGIRNTDRIVRKILGEKDVCLMGERPRFIDSSLTAERPAYYLAQVHSTMSTSLGGCWGSITGPRLSSAILNPRQ
jgi:hypothetical protein